MKIATIKKHKTIDQDDFFGSVTRNAIDFLKKSVSELDQAPKYSVINFCAALELFLKCRLLAEHWSLIVTNQDKSSISKFKSGDFHSVGMQEAIRRIENICGEKISDKAVDKFENIRNHRNKLIHFFHEKYLTKPDTTTLDEVIPEQYSAWYYLHQLISKDWGKFFSEYNDDISELERLMHRHKEFLKAKYDAIKEEIEKEKQNGIKFTTCFYCKFPTSRVDISLDPLFICDCLVCQMYHNFLVVSCPDCKSNIQVIDSGVGVCEKCGFETDIDFILSVFGPKEDPKEESEYATCGICEFIGGQTVIPFQDEHLCLYCLELTGSPTYCDWCNELVAGRDMDGSYYGGCVMCEGKSGED